MSTAWITCDDCGGSGEITRFARWIGEGNGGEFVSDGYCPECDGQGGWEEEIEETISTKTLAELRAEQLTDTISDLFLKHNRRAA